MSVISASMGRETPARMLEHAGYFRRSKARYQNTAGHKEWLHFAFHGEGVDALVNFSVVDDVRSGARRGAEHARIVCLVRERGWRGDIDHFESAAVDVRGGALSARFGKNHAIFRDGRLHVKVRMRREPLAFDLELEPVTYPTLANNISIDDCPPIHWIVVPRLLATGTIRVEDREYRLDRAVAYHDHNWGSFRWGKNFAWEWGYAAEKTNQAPWSFVFVRLTDRGHLTDLMRVITVWRGERQVRLFRAGEIEVFHEGLLRGRRVFKVPSVMALVAPGDVTDVPKRWIARVRRGDDRLDVVFEARDPAQVIIPNDDDLGVTIIHEVSGDVSVEGRIDGERVAFSETSIFEFLGE
jgi:hypothetical protein